MLALRLWLLRCTLLHGLGSTILLRDRRHGGLDIPLKLFVAYSKTRSVKCFDELNGTGLCILA